MDLSLGNQVKGDRKESKGMVRLNPRHKRQEK